MFTAHTMLIINIALVVCWNKGKNIPQFTKTSLAGCLEAILTSHSQVTICMPEFMFAQTNAHVGGH